MISSQAEFSTYLKTHTFAALSFVFALALILAAALATFFSPHTSYSQAAIQFALLGGFAGFIATALGAFPALFLKGISKSLEATLLGFSAGMMLSASVFSLIIPGLEAGETIFASNSTSFAVVSFGMLAGLALMLGLDRFIPHEHERGGPCGYAPERCRRLWLFVFAITLHNLPEGMAIGVGFSQGDFSAGLPIASAISLQNIPEGLAVALALSALVQSKWKGFLLAAATGLVEPLGALIGLALVGGLVATYPVGLGLAAGAMIFVVLNEIVPEIHQDGHQTKASIGAILGFIAMMGLDRLI